MSAEAAMVGLAEHRDAAGRAGRLSPAELGLDPKVRLMPGGDALMLNISSTGLLVEGKERLGMHGAVMARIKGSVVKRLSGRVVRSRVVTLHRDGTLSYESAIEFERPLDLDELAREQAAAAAAAAQKCSTEDVYVLDADSEW